MTNEEKQALIVDCEAEINNLEWRISRTKETGGSTSYLESCLKRQQIALASLTAQPVKLEPIIQIGYTQDEITCMCNVRNDDIKAIRAAGYEVQE